MVSRKSSELPPGPHEREAARTFSWPHEVALDPALSAEEKRTILTAWASETNAVESMPALRRLPGTPCPVTYSSITTAQLQVERMVQQGG